MRGLVKYTMEVCGRLFAAEPELPNRSSSPASIALRQHEPMYRAGSVLEIQVHVKGAGTSEAHKDELAWRRVVQAVRERAENVRFVVLTTGEEVMRATVTSGENSEAILGIQGVASMRVLGVQELKPPKVSALMQYAAD